MILGLDISTSVVGFTVTDFSGKVDKIDFLNLKKIPDLMEKADQIRILFFELALKHGITHIYIEENLQAFRPGASSASTIAKLARFNGIVSYLAYDIFEIKPYFLNVTKARSAVGLKIKRQKKCGISTKDQVLSWAQINLNQFTWPTKVLKSGPRKGTTVFLDECYDMADSLVISLAGLEHLKESG